MLDDSRLQLARIADQNGSDDCIDAGYKLDMGEDPGNNQDLIELVAVLPLGTVRSKLVRYGEPAPVGEFAMSLSVI